MRRFKFNLESVLMLRKHALEDERIKLSKIIQAYNSQKNILENLTFELNSLNAGQEEYFKQMQYNPGLIQNYNQYVSKLINEVVKQENVLKKIEKDIDLQQFETKKAYIALKSLENLKEKQKEKYNKELQQEEIKILDDIVNSKRTA